MINSTVQTYTVGTTLQLPIVALDFVMHLTVKKGCVMRYNNNGEGGDDRDMGATCTKK